MTKGPTTKQKFNVPAAYSVGSVAPEGKNAMQIASFNVQHAGFNVNKHRRGSAAPVMAAKAGGGGAVGMLGLATYIPRRAPRTSAPGYTRASLAPAPSFFGIKAAA